MIQRLIPNNHKETPCSQHTDPLDKIRNYHSHFKFRKTIVVLRSHQVTDYFNDNKSKYLAMLSNYIKIQFDHKLYNIKLR